MRTLLWTILTVSVVANVYASVGVDGVAGVLLNVVSGVATLASGVALWVTRPGPRHTWRLVRG